MSTRIIGPVLHRSIYHADAVEGAITVHRADGSARLTVVDAPDGWRICAEGGADPGLSKRTILELMNDALRLSLEGHLEATVT